MDELFKNKLEHHSLPPSAEAWDKVERQLEKKNKPVIWWRAAAAVLLVSVVGWWAYTWQSSGNVNQNVAKSNPEVAPTQVPLKVQTPTNATESTTTPALEAPKQLTQPALAKAEPMVSENQPATSAAKETVPSMPEAPTVTEVTLPVQATTSADVEKPIVLEFTLDPIATEAVATPRAEKRSIKSVLIELKNGEGTFNLQTLKENLFAFNHQKPKPTETKE
ncbi:MAG: hypothetical protein ACKOE6_05315 [Flammeovirgaceae bacterium]